MPFIDRYRKEVTGGLDDTQLRLLEQRLSYLRELEERRSFILSTIESQKKLTPELKNDINIQLIIVRWILYFSRFFLTIRKIDIQ